MLLQDQRVDGRAGESGQVRRERFAGVVRRGGSGEGVVFRREVERAEAGAADVGDERVAHVGVRKGAG